MTQLKDTYPLYLNNKAAQPNTDLEVTDKFTVEVAFRTGLATADLEWKMTRLCSLYESFPGNRTYTLSSPNGSAVTLKVPAGTPNGRTFRVRGRGAPKKDGTKGDLLATVQVQVPARLNDAAREAIANYRAAGVDGTLRANLFEGSGDASA